MYYITYLYITYPKHLKLLYVKKQCSKTLLYSIL